MGWLHNTERLTGSATLSYRVGEEIQAAKPVAIRRIAEAALTQLKFLDIEGSSKRLFCQSHLENLFC